MISTFINNVVKLDKLGEFKFNRIIELKNQILIFTSCVAIISCSGTQLDSEIENNSMVVQAENTDSVGVNNNQTNHSKKAFFSHKVTKSSDAQDARNLSNDEVEISLYIGETIIDTYKDFGSVEYIEDKTVLFISSDFSEKTYILELLNETHLKVKKITYFDGEEILDWKKTYVVEI
jgi:hypothetical protein